MQLGDSLPDVFSGILLDPSVSNQTSLMNIDEIDYDIDSALAEWENNMTLPNFDSSQSSPISSQETSQRLSVAPESSQSRADLVTSADDEETICYGMVSGLCICLSDTSGLSNLGHNFTYASCTTLKSSS